MSDVVVTVSKRLWLSWLEEGDVVDEPETGTEWSFYIGCLKPRIVAGDRVYVVAFDLLRGYAPLVRVETTHRGHSLVRRGGAVATTIDEEIRGFQGWRYRFWQRSAEKPFRDWMTANVTPSLTATAAWNMQEQVRFAVDRRMQERMRRPWNDER